MAPPGRDAEAAPDLSKGAASTEPQQPPGREATSTVAPGADSGRDLDADLSVIRTVADELGVWLAIWSARAEPDAHARRCASDGILAIDAALAALYRVRARWVTETHQADDAAMDRAGALLDRLRDDSRP